MFAVLHIIEVSHKVTIIRRNIVLQHLSIPMVYEFVIRRFYRLRLHLTPTYVINDYAVYNGVDKSTTFNTVFQKYRGTESARNNRKLLLTVYALIRGLDSWNFHFEMGNSVIWVTYNNDDSRDMRASNLSFNSIDVLVPLDERWDIDDGYDTYSVLVGNTLRGVSE